MKRSKHGQNSNNETSISSPPSPAIEEPQLPSTTAPDLIYPYSLPAPPKSYFFGGTGWGFGLGCGVGPFFGIGVGFGVPYGVVFGAGPGLGAVCGVGFGSGVILGSGSAYIPFGFASSLFYAPRLWSAEKAVDVWRKRALQKRKGKRWIWLDNARMWVRNKVFQIIRGEPKESTRKSSTLDRTNVLGQAQQIRQKQKTRKNVAFVQVASITIDESYRIRDKTISRH